MPANLFLTIGSPMLVWWLHGLRFHSRNKQTSGDGEVGDRISVESFEGLAGSSPFPGSYTPVLNPARRVVVESAMFKSV
uniref:Uncharacterized protein n=1 Tax=Timema bartmani TaxID=61472 RepID=A0A7R9HZT6_9NEOP|nr:unnamed protein product [Timema bartmani]